eukprot:GHVU01123189.1.p1 GENE.GHVU01123189.1~~GHVU01123189.1.p1  ORF type:complete len:189 (+),score=10.53 GHVU01123189.1:64-630(+)
MGRGKDWHERLSWKDRWDERGYIGPTWQTATRYGHPIFYSEMMHRNIQEISELVRKLSMYNVVHAECWRDGNVVSDHQYVVLTADLINGGDDRRVYIRFDKFHHGLEARRGSSVNEHLLGGKVQRRVGDLNANVAGGNGRNLGEVMNANVWNSEMNLGYNWGGNDCRYFAQRIYNRFVYGGVNRKILL